MNLLSLFVLLIHPDLAWLDHARDLFFKFDQDDCKSKELYEYLKDKKTDNQALFLAYSGAALASSADCTVNPAAKFKRFREGRNMIEEAIDQNPDHPEIRFLRLSVQSKAPSFLNYSVNVDGDRKMVLESIQGENKIWNDLEFTRKVLTFVRLHTLPNEEERKLIDQLISNY